MDAKGILTKNLAGQCILFITGIMYLFVIVKSIQGRQIGRERAMKTVLQLLFLLVAVLPFTTIQSLLLRKSGRTSLTFVKEELERAGNSKTFKNFVGKETDLVKKHGADVFLQDGESL